MRLVPNQRKISVSIPQAVGTVATCTILIYIVFPHDIVSIPQAVGTVATTIAKEVIAMNKVIGFNTASGRYCCNNRVFTELIYLFLVVSIPQAVGTVATVVLRG